jgi:hypothetical protein
MSVCNLSLLADVAICDDLPADDPMKMVMVKSLMARDIGKNSHLDYIARALTRPWTGLPAIETLRVELLRFKRTFPNAKFSIGMDNHAFLVRVPFVCNAGHSVDLLPCIFPHGEDDSSSKISDISLMQCVILIPCDL